jgi:ketosteroid isomerase-like protein
MVTIGRGLHASVHELFEGIRTYDPKRSVAVLADDAELDSPWSGHLHGKTAIEAFLKGWLADPKTRPSFTISDVAGDGALSRLKVSVSGRFGKAPELHHFHILRVKDRIHQVRVVPEKGIGGHH